RCTSGPSSARRRIQESPAQRTGIGCTGSSPNTATLISVFMAGPRVLEVRTKAARLTGDLAQSAPLIWRSLCPTAQKAPAVGCRNQSRFGQGSAVVKGHRASSKAPILVLAAARRLGTQRQGGAHHFGPHSHPSGYLFARLARRRGSCPRPPNFADQCAAPPAVPVALFEVYPRRSSSSHSRSFSLTCFDSSSSRPTCKMNSSVRATTR